MEPTQQVDEATSIRELLELVLAADRGLQEKLNAVKQLNECRVPDWSAWDEPPSHTMRRFLDAVESPQFVADWRGYKFVSNLMAAYPEQIENIHYAVLLTMGKLPTVQHACYYGKMYTRAWDKCGAQGRREIRLKCVENIAQYMMGLSRQDESYGMGELNHRLFIIMDYFFNMSVHSAEVAAMMCEVVEDFVWPHLKDQGTVWRCNAADALFLAYPMDKPMKTPEEKRDYIHRQHEEMLTLLSDTSHYVRYIAVGGILCKVLPQYWHLVTDDIRRKFFKNIFSERPFDGDCRVRQQVFRGARKLLSRAEASVDLEGMLPELRNCFHDVNSTVRLEFIRLLLAIKQRELFPFYYSVSLDHLVARLGDEVVDENIEALVRLLLPYFCPLEEPEETLIKRIFAMHRMNEVALWKLFLHSEGILSNEEAVQVIHIILGAVHRGAKDRESATPVVLRKSGQRTKSSKQRASRKSRDIPAEIMEPSDPTGAAALLQVVGILWKSRLAGIESGAGAETEDRGATDETLRVTLADVMPVIHRAFQGTVAQPALEVLSSIGGESVLGEAMHAVLSATEENAQEIVVERMDVITNQDGEAELLAVLSDAVASAWGRGRDRGQASHASHRGRRRSCNLPSPAAALVMLETLFNKPMYSTGLVQRHNAEVDAFIDKLKQVQTLLSTRVGAGSPLTLRRKPHLTDDFLERCFQLYLTAVVARGIAGAGSASKRPQDKTATIAIGIDVLNWAERFLVPSLPDTVEAGPAPAAPDGAPTRPLVVRVLREVLLVVGQMIGGGLYDGPLVASCIEFSHLLMTPAVRYLDFHVIIADIMVSSLAGFKQQDVDGDGLHATLMGNHIYPAVCALLDLLPEFYAGEDLDPKTVEDAVVVTASVAYQTLLACEMFFKKRPELQTGVIAAMSWNVVEIVRREMSKGALAVPRLSDLPVSCGYLLAPLEETASRLSKLVESVMDAYQPAEVTVKMAIKYILTALKSGPVAKRANCKKKLEKAISQIQI